MLGHVVPRYDWEVVGGWMVNGGVTEGGPLKIMALTVVLLSLSHDLLWEATGSSSCHQELDITCHAFPMMSSETMIPN